MTGSSPPSEPSQPSQPSQPSSSEEPIEAELLPLETEAPRAPAPDYDERGVPSLDYVRDKIESRFATALGSTELAEDQPQSQSLEAQQAERDRAAKARLDEIRRNLGS